MCLSSDISSIFDICKFTYKVNIKSIQSTNMLLVLENIVYSLSYRGQLSIGIALSYLTADWKIKSAQAAQCHLGHVIFFIVVHFYNFLWASCAISLSESLWVRLSLLRVGTNTPSPYFEQLLNGKWRVKAFCLWCLNPNIASFTQYRIFNFFYYNVDVFTLTWFTS